MSNKKRGKRGKSSRKRGKKAATSRRGRGLTAPFLPFRAKTYGKDLPAWAKELGWTGDTIPVVHRLSQPKEGFYSLMTGGAPGNKPKGKPRPRTSKAVRLESQLAKAVAALGKAMGSGANEAKLRDLKERVQKLKQFVIDEAVLMAEIQAEIANASPAAIERRKRAEAKRKAKEVGGTPQMADASVKKEPTTAERKAAEQAAVAYRDTPEGQAMIRRGLFGPPEPAGRDIEEERRRERLAQMRPNPFDGLYENPDDDVYGNPDVVFMKRTGRGKKARTKRTVLDMQPVPRGTPGAVTVVVGPEAYRYATLALKEVKKNGLYSRSTNMAKRRMRANPLTDDLMALGRPVLGATAGFAASRAVNALALYGLSKTKMGQDNAASNAYNVGVRAAATALGVVGTLTLGDKVGYVRDNRTSIVTGMILNVLEGAVRTFASGGLSGSDANPYVRNLALGDSGYSGYYDMSHAGAPYSPMMGEYVSQSLNGMGEYVSQSLNGGMGSYIAQAAAGMGEYVSQSLNGSGDGLGEYVSQSLNGYAEGVDPSDQEGVDAMINTAESVAGLGATEVMAATAGLDGTQVMAATAGLGATQGMNRGIVTRRGVYNFFTQPVMAGRANIPAVSIEDAPMPVVNMGGAVPGAVPISDQVSTPEGRGYAGGIFGRNVFGTMGC